MKALAVAIYVFAGITSAVLAVKMDQARDYRPRPIIYVQIAVAWPVFGLIGAGHLLLTEPSQ